MAYYSKYKGAELEERLDKVEEIPQLIAQMITGKDFVTKEDLLCVLKDYAPADYRTIPIDNNTIYWENGVLKAATSEGGQCQWELREHNGIQYLYSRLPVVTQYDVTMYADVNHLDLPSIYDGLPIDGDTIYWEETEDGKVLKAKSVGGSGENIDAGWVISVISNAGFATQNWVNSQNFISSSLLYTELAKYVKIKDYQEIEGVKNFLNGLQIAGLPITKLNGYEDVIYIDANVVVRGGLTMYYEEGEIDLPTIKDEIGNAGYDGVTGLASFNSSQFFISNDGTVTIIGGSTGLDTAQLKEYLDSNKYTTETWVKEQGYASATSLSSLQTKVNNFLEGSDTDTIINKWKELEAFLSGLSESDNLADILSAKANQSSLDATNAELATKWTTDNSLINKWNTAYGWGDHSKVGYALKSYVDGTFVTIKGNEDVTGVHDFVNGLKIGNIKLSKSQEGVVYLEGNLVVKGGVTMYALDEVTVDSIIDSLPLASTSQYGIAKFNPSNFIINEDGFVTIIGGSSGLDTEELAEYLAINKYATQGWVEGKGYITSSALNGYATQSWVTNQKYITGITSAMVVSALGFTPYNSANFTKANIKSTLGISDWALASTKPSYNFSEIGTKPTTIAGYGITDAYTIQQADALYAKYLPLTGGTLTGELKIAKVNGIAYLCGYGANGGIAMHFGYKKDEYLRIDVCNSTGGYVNQTLQIDKNNRVSINYLNVGSGLNGDRKAEYRLGVYGTFGVTGTSTFKAMTTHSAGLTSTIGNFSGEVSMQSANINGGKITYDATNKYWKLEGDLLVTGGVSMYSDDSEFIPSTIMDGVVVDGTSIRKNPTTGALEVIGGSGATVKYPLSWSGFNQGSYDGSVAQSFYIPTKLSEFVNDKSFATTSDLSGYLPLSGGTVRGILTIGGRLILRNGNAIQFTNADNKELLFYPYSQYNGDLGYYNGSSWGKVWTSANDGSGSGLDADLLDGKHASQFIGLYTREDVGTTINFDNPHVNGFFEIRRSKEITSTGIKPFDDFAPILSLKSQNVMMQIAGKNNQGWWIRGRQKANVTLEGVEWQQLARTTDNVASATKLQTARAIWGQSFDGTGNIEGAITIKHYQGLYQYSTNSELLMYVGYSYDNKKIYLYNGKKGSHLSLFDDGRISLIGGNVLIGTTTDSGYKLDITNKDTNNVFIARGKNAHFRVGYNCIMGIESNNGGWIVYSGFARGEAARFEVMDKNSGWVATGWRLFSNGNMLIGNGQNNGYKLDVNGTIHTNSSLWIDNIEVKKSQNDVLYIDGNLVVRGGVTMYAENEVDIPSIIDSLPIANANTQDKASKGIASFDSTYFKVTDGWVTLTSAPSSISTIGSLQDVSSSVSGTTNSDVVLFKSANSSTWTTKPLSEIGGGGGSVSGDYLPLSGGTLTGTVTFQTNGNNAFNINEIGEGNAGFSFQKNGSTLGAIRLDENREPSWMYSKTWTWETMLHSGNYSSYALPLSGGTINGKITVSGIGGWAIEQKKGDSYVFSLGSGSASTSVGTENGILQLYQNDLEVVRLYAASGENNWILNNLGIKTSNPSYTLDVNGTFHSNYAMISSNRIDPLHVNNSTSGASHSCMVFCTNGTFRSQFGYAGGGTYYYNYASDSYIKLLDAMEGNVKYIEVSDNIYIGTANRKNLLGLHSSYLLLGYSAMEANIPTYIDGAEIYLRYGANWSNVVHFKSDNSVQIPGVLYFGEHGKTSSSATNIGYIGRGSTDNRMILYCTGETYIYSKGVLAVKLSSANMLVSGGITMYSDKRKKTILNHVELSLKQIADAPLIEHYYNSDQDKTTHVGSIAQYWAGLNDWFCKLDNEGFYTMEIQNCALASAISIARHLEKYESKTDKKIRMLKKRVQELEDEVERLKNN